MTGDHSQALLNEIREIRKLLELVAEPAIAKRDAKLRAQLQDLVGSSPKKQKSVLLMDGSRTQAQIISQTSVHQGDLSTLVGRLEKAGLLANGKKQPKLGFSIPADFFDAKP